MGGVDKKNSVAFKELGCCWLVFIFCSQKYTIHNNTRHQKSIREREYKCVGGNWQIVVGTVAVALSLELLDIF